MLPNNPQVELPAVASGLGQFRWLLMQSTQKHGDALRQRFSKRFRNKHLNNVLNLKYIFAWLQLYHHYCNTNQHWIVGKICFFVILKEPLLLHPKFVKLLKTA